MAVLALAADNTCAAATDVSDICMGDCRTPYDNIINNCDATVSEYSYIYVAIPIATN